MNRDVLYGMKATVGVFETNGVTQVIIPDRETQNEAIVGPTW